MNFKFSFRPTITAPQTTTVRNGAYENLAEARVFAKGFARRQPDNETVLIESEDGYVRERWIWLNGVWERDDLL